MTVARKQPSAPALRQRKSRKGGSGPVIVAESPPKIMPGHIKEVRAGLSNCFRQTRADPLRGYADAGQITEDQLMAGKWYEENFAMRDAGSRDSTDLDRVSGAGGGLSITDRQADATKKIIAVESRLSVVDRRLIRQVCGEGMHATQAVKMVTGQISAHYPVPRFKEALDNLRGAIIGAKRDGWKFSMDSCKG